MVMCDGDNGDDGEVVYRDEEPLTIRPALCKSAHK